MREYVKNGLKDYAQSLGAEFDPGIHISAQMLFIEIFSRVVKRDNAEGLLNYLKIETDFFTAPASTKFHNSFDQGLVEHSLNVFYRLRQLVAASHLEIEYSDETLAIIALLHDVCKTNVYTLDYRNVKIYSPLGTKHDAKGSFDWEMVETYMYKENIHLSHGTKSLYIIQNFMSLTQDEAVAIQRHMGGYDFPGTSVVDPYAIAAFRPVPLALLLFTADSWATFIDEDEPVV